MAKGLRRHGQVKIIVGGADDRQTVAANVSAQELYPSPPTKAATARFLMLDSKGCAPGFLESERRPSMASRRVGPNARGQVLMANTGIS